MGGRGSYSSTRGASIESLISEVEKLTKEDKDRAAVLLEQIEAKQKAVKEEMEHFSKIKGETSRDATGYPWLPDTTKRNYDRFYAAHRQYQRLQGVNSKLLTAWTKVRNIVRVEEPAPKKPFINAYGEATHRYVTTATYERSLKRKAKEVEGFLSGR